MPRFWEKASVQTAIATGATTLVAVALTFWLPARLEAPRLRQELSQMKVEHAKAHEGWRADLQKVSDEKNTALQEVQRLEILLVPFRTMALERYTGTEAERLAKLALKLGELEVGLRALQDYSHVAVVDIVGLPAWTAGKGIQIESKISVRMARVWKDEPGISRLQVTEEAVAAARDVIRTDPDFPFAYFALAGILKAQGVPEWRNHAESALRILRATTTIAGSHPNHREALQKVEQMLKEPDPALTRTLPAAAGGRVPRR